MLVLASQCVDRGAILRSRSRKAGGCLNSAGGKYGLKRSDLSLRRREMNSLVV